MNTKVPGHAVLDSPAPDPLDNSAPDPKSAPRVRLTARNFVLGGLFILAIGLYVGEFVHHIETDRACAGTAHSDADNFYLGSLYVGSLISAIILFIQTIGTAAIVVGVVNISIETQDWRKYFEERLRGVVTQHSYLDKLSPGQLEELRNRVFKSHFHDPQIDRDGSFLKFFDRHLFHLVGTPYRENLLLYITVTPAEQPSKWHVVDRVRYSCRKAGGRIQSSVAWGAEQQLEMLRLQVAVIIPEGTVGEGKPKVIKTLEQKDFVSPPGSSLDEYPSSSLDEYKDRDGLIVEIQAEYNVNKTQFVRWAMAVPTKKFSIAIRYPSEVCIQCEVLILDKTLITRHEDIGFLTLASDAWILPQSGLVWRLCDRIEQGEISVNSVHSS
jgi:hypothetical protein